LIIFNSGQEVDANMFAVPPIINAGFTTAQSNIR
jgi:hypothetical protein